MVVLPNLIPMIAQIDSIDTILLIAIVICAVASQIASQRNK